MDEDLEQLTRAQLIDEAKKLRQGIRRHRDSSGHELCWHHPSLWGLLPEETDPVPVVPEWPQFMKGCVRYRQSLDQQAPNAPRSNEPYREMTEGKSVLVIGLDPNLIDFSAPDFAAWPGMDATKVLTGLKSAEEALTRLGYSVQTCLTDFGETAEATVRSRLLHKRFDCVLIGAGIRAAPGNFLLFEKLINVVHEHAPQARLCFNTKPEDTIEAVQRWL